MAPVAPRRASWLNDAVKTQEFGLVVVICVAILIIGLSSRNFLSAGNFDDIVTNMAILVIVSCGQMMVVLTRGIDLSVGSVMGLVAVSVGAIFRSHPDLPTILAPVIGIAMGAVVGMINGTLVTLLRIPPIIVTLGTLQVFRGLMPRISFAVHAFEIPEGIINMTRATTLGIPNLIVFAVVIAIAVHLFVTQSRTGRQLYAIGSNPDAAALAGIQVNRKIFLVYVLSGILAGFAGVLWLSRYANAETTSAIGFEFQTVASIVVGGVNVFGGSGTVIGVVLGTFLLGVIKNAMVLAHISALWQQAVQGFAILAAVTLNTLLQRRLRRQRG
jgi:rhamnose transport system permease protein